MSTSAPIYRPFPLLDLASSRTMKPRSVDASLAPTSARSFDKGLPVVYSEYSRLGVVPVGDWLWGFLGRNLCPM